MHLPTIELLNTALAGRYRVERELGEGGMARVFLAHDLRHDRDVALKVLRAELADIVGSARFLREVHVTARLLHPHILPLLDSGDANGLLFYVMPFVPGETLAGRLQREGQLPVEEAVAIARDVASALAHAHAHGVVHRDIKPDNVLFQDGMAVVADFGVAGMLDEDGIRLTSTGLSIGTPLYMSPEQAAGSQLDARSDVYSLGCVLYEMLAGEPPFTGGSAQNIILKKMTEAAPLVRRLRESVPVAIEAAISRALQRTPADRFASVEAFSNALESGLATQEAVTTPPSITQGIPRTTAASRTTTSRSRLIPAGILLVVIAIGAITMLMMQREDRVVIPAPVTFRQITREAGAELFPSLRADGSEVVYSRDGDLWLRNLAGETERRLTEQPELNNTQPAFSPDGHLVAFRSDRDGGGIFLLDVDSGTVERLTTLGFNPAWSPDGKSIVFANEGVTDAGTRRGISNIFVVDVTTRAQHQLGDMDGVQPNWSPHGSRIAFWSVAHDGQLTAQRDIWTVRSDGSDPVAITNDAAVDWDPVWEADGRSIIFSSNRGGSMNLWRVPIDETTGRVLGDPVPVTEGGSASREHVAVTASRTLYVERLTTANIFRVPFDPARGAVTGPPIAVTRGTRMAMEPAVSPNGSRVAFYTLSDDMQIYVVNADGSDLHPLTSGPAKYRSPQWSPDGSRIAFHSDRGGNYEIWSVDSTGQKFTQLTHIGRIAIYPFWDRTGDRVGFVDLGRGVATVPALGSNAGAQMLLQGDLMVRPSWSPDGQRIAGTLPPAAGGTGIVVHTLSPPSTRTISSFGDAPQWLPDSRRLVFVWKSTLYLADVISGNVKPILAEERDILGLGSLTRDGRWIYFSRTVTEGDIWSIEPRQ